MPPFCSARPLLLTIAAPPPSAGQSRRASVDGALLTFAREDLSGKMWRNSDLRGRITLIDFWATWCAPCVRELPFLKRAHELYAGEFEILGISLDTFSPRNLRDWTRREDVTWPQIHARGGYRDSIALAFGVDRLPTNLLLDQDGKVRATNVRGRDLFIEIEKLRKRPAQREGAGQLPDSRR